MNMTKSSESFVNIFSSILAKYAAIFFFELFVIILFSSSNITAQGDLIVFPKRVVFEGTQRIRELNLANTGQDTATYIISVVQIRMKEDGGFENIMEPDPGQKFAENYIRIFPRRVVLAPNEAQLVKVQLTRTSELTEGEYRSHLYFRAEPVSKPLVGLNSNETPKDSNAISVRIVPIFGMTIPVIIRVGESTTKVSFSDLGLEMYKDTIPTLKMSINRTGNMSVYGDINVEHISPEGKITRVGNVQGVAVYTPNLVRRARIELNKKLGINYKTGKLRLEYSAQREDKNAKLAEAELQLQ
jgi:hypothetical protein